MSKLNPKTPILSIRQPYASFILFPCDRLPKEDDPGLKDVENRSRKAPDWLIGNQLYIHAGKKLYEGYKENDFPFFSDNRAYLRGYVLGIVTLVDCIKDSDSPWALSDNWHWVLSNPEPLDEPVPIKGQLGLFYAKN